MQNLSALSRAELIGALLAPVLPKDHPHADQVNDLESVYFGTAAVASDASDTLLDHKLGVARELLMRDLRAQLSAGPVMSSPQALRDWLRLHFKHLSHAEIDSYQPGTVGDTDVKRLVDALVATFTKPVF
ncbi:MAG: hypothetical protein K2Q07_05145, partial [Burkholderiaceae bacterium]|nr:hypothetical protein [Burkholderiaceae bacterium]